MQSAAFVVGPEDGPGRTLVQLARRIGFKHIAFYRDAAQVAVQARLTPICFFLVGPGIPKPAMSEFLGEIRHHRDRMLRFSPLLYLSEDPSPGIIQFCVRIGFDDIVALPFSPSRLKERLLTHIGTSRHYFETASYFGPDRRQGHGPAPLVGERRGTGGDFSCYEIRRDLESGTRIVREYTERAETVEAHLI